MQCITLNYLVKLIFEVIVFLYFLIKVFFTDYQSSKKVNANFTVELLKDLNKYDRSEFKFGSNNLVANRKFTSFLNEILIISLLFFVIYHFYFQFLFS